MKIIFSTTVFVLTFGTIYATSRLEKQTRIIGGEAAKPGQFPSVVSIQRLLVDKGTFRHFCAGSIVDATHIVTAAHCVWNKLNTSLIVIAGSLNISGSVDGQQRINVSAIHVHPKYAGENRAGAFDIAVVELAKAITFDNNTKPATLPTQNQEASGECQYAGWGNRFLISGISYQPSDVLKTVNSTVISKFRCSGSYFFLLRRQLRTAICTAAGPLRGSCQGDSGGPLTCFNSDGTPYLAGIVSWGWVVCGDGFHPDVSTNVAQFTDFIKGFI